MNDDNSGERALGHEPIPPPEFDWDSPEADAAAALINDYTRFQLDRGGGIQRALDAIRDDMDRQWEALRDRGVS